MGGPSRAIRALAGRRTEARSPARRCSSGHALEDAMGLRLFCLFPDGMHAEYRPAPQIGDSRSIVLAYNRWVTEKVLPEVGGPLFSMLCLPFSDPGRTLRQIETSATAKGRRRLHGATVTNLRVHDNAYRQCYGPWRSAAWRSASIPARPGGRSRCQELTNRFIFGACDGLQLIQILHPQWW